MSERERERERERESSMECCDVHETASGVGDPGLRSLVYNFFLSLIHNVRNDRLSKTDETCW